MIMAGANAIGIWRGMKKASEFLLLKIKQLARPISSSEDIHHIGEDGGCWAGREGARL
jgi:chaperonin GroEL (HSP60 family)